LGRKRWRLKQPVQPSTSEICSHFARATAPGPAIAQ
jgi:hypothetical protein